MVQLPTLYRHNIRTRLCYVLLPWYHSFHLKYLPISFGPISQASGLSCDVVLCIIMIISVVLSVRVDACNAGTFFTWWRHQMETLYALLALCEGNPPDSPHKGQWSRALIFSLICAWTNSWAHNGDTDDLRRHRVHYDVNVMLQAYFNGTGASVWLSQCQWSNFEIYNA